MKRIVLLSMCMLLFVAVGCGKQEVELKDGKEVVASIKGKKVTAEDLFNDLKEKYGSSTLVNIIDEYIANKEIKTTDEMKETAKSQIDEMKNYYESNGANWNDILKQYGYSSESVLVDEYVLNAKKEEVVKNYLKTKVTDDEINAYYDKEIYGNYTVKHILITPDVNDDMSDDEKKEAEEKALKTAENVIKKLDDGEKWADLVKKYSDDEASVSDEGKIADFTKGDVVDEFFEAVLELKDNEYTKEPVESAYGYHIILKVSSTEKPKLDKVKDEVITKIVENKLTNDQTLYNTSWEKVREDYELKINDTELENGYKSLLKGSN